MGFAPATVTRELTMEVVVPADGPQHVPVVMRYDTADPYAVCAEFHSAPGHAVAWRFARELMSNGISAPAGEGDVRIWPFSCHSAGRVRIALTSPEGQALVQAATSEVVEFLSESYSLCPPGEEAGHLDVDGALKALLAS